MGIRRLSFLFVGTMLVSGCSFLDDFDQFEFVDGGGVDAAVDGATPDGATMDGSMVDGAADSALPSSCTDGMQNGTETDQDCGGDCSPCDIDEGCATGDDCVTGSCDGAVCLAPACDDGVQNGQESDVDCGVACDVGCTLGSVCAEDDDCASALCIEGSCYGRFATASNGESEDRFGTSLAISGDGSTMVVGAREEDTCPDRDVPNNGCPDGGAAYVFVQDAAGAWDERQILYASNARAGIWFGSAVAVSEDGGRIVVAAQRENNCTGGVNVDESNAACTQAGAVYVFLRGEDGEYTQEAYIKADMPTDRDVFGVDISLSADASVLAVGASSEDSCGTGIDATLRNDDCSATGAAYIFRRREAGWVQTNFIKAPNPDSNDAFGRVALSGDGNILAVGAGGERGCATGVSTLVAFPGPDDDDDGCSVAGVVYTYQIITGTETWRPVSYVKSTFTEDFGMGFGVRVEISGDGSRMIVGDQSESGCPRGVGGDPSDNDRTTCLNRGAVYVFRRTSTSWEQEAYIKAENAENQDFFGSDVAVSADAEWLLVAASNEDGCGTGLTGDPTNNGCDLAGAAYLYRRAAADWSFVHYVKPPDTAGGDAFRAFEVALPGDASFAAFTTAGDDSCGQGFDEMVTDNGCEDSGALHLLYRTGDTWQ